ncbi:MAG: metalloregulator ArsR/SmtB family transcription factor [Candidatus Cloacimonadota bacterium]|nr:metalloregulator ArsR/SmtB family transcription factor [Candidatus Cloacimonadota bacterium]
MLDEFVIRKLCKLFNVLSNEVRIRIIYTLMEKKSLTVTEISDELGIPQNTLSAHLKVLYDGAYIDKDQKWRNVHYCIREEKLKKILEEGTQILYDKWEGNWEKIAEAKKTIKKVSNSKKQSGGK